MRNGETCVQCRALEPFSHTLCVFFTPYSTEHSPRPYGIGCVSAGVVGEESKFKIHTEMENCETKNNIMARTSSNINL